MDIVALALFWSLAAAALARGGTMLVVLFFVSSAFGSFAVVPPAVSGGISLTALPVMGLLVILRQLAGASGIAFVLSALRFRRLGILAAFWLIALLTTLLMPRFLAGQVSVVPMRYLFDANQPLAPSMQNFTQIAYLTISVLTVFAFTRLLRHPAGRLQLIDGLFAGAIALVVTGILDALAQSVGPVQMLLEGFRTAAYTLRVEDEVLGAKRIVGLMPEASVYGEFCVTMLAILYFLRHGLPEGSRWRPWLWPLIGALLILTYLSTSSAAYVGLAVLAGFAALEWVWRALFGRADARSRRRLGNELGAVAAIAVVVLLAALIRPSLFDPVTELVTELVFRKTASDSFEERSLWTAISLQAAIDSYGLGVGVGATRASSSFVSGLSNFGVFGGGLYVLFILQCYRQKAARDDANGAAILSAFRWAMVPPTVVGWLIGTSPDFGCLRAAMYGAMIAIGMEAVRQRKGSRPSVRPMRPVLAGPEGEPPSPGGWNAARRPLASM